MGSAPEPEPSCALPFPVGCTVTIEGLKSQPEHNGCDGVVLQHIESAGRCKVKMLSCGWVLSVRSENLRLGSLRASDAEQPVCSAADLAAATSALRERQAPSKEALK